MKGLSQRLHILETLPDEVHECLMSESPQEFLKIQRIHAEMTFFRGNDNILHMLFNAHEGSGFDIVIPAVGYKILDCRPCSRKELHLIENDQRFPFMQRYIIVI